MQVPGVRELTESVVGLDASDQAHVDEVAAEQRDRQGLANDITVAISLAVARARASREQRSLASDLAERASTTPSFPRLLVNVFSGGIHTGPAADQFQQVMATPNTGTVVSDIVAARVCWDEAAKLAQAASGAAPTLSPSSGMLIQNSTDTQLEILKDAIANSALTGPVEIGIDVAAEHLRAGPGQYRLDGCMIDTTTLAQLLLDQVNRTTTGDNGHLTVVEDPFDPGEAPRHWAAFTDELRGRATVIGDDLFVSDALRLNSRLASAVLLKPSQAGNVTELLHTAAKARTAGMAIVLSHRSGETEDTAVCDLAVSLGADFLKIGGPRRGDRISKYNQILRLTEEINHPAAPRHTNFAIEQERITA